MTHAPLSRRERKKQQNRQRLLEAATHLFQTQGFDATTIDDIAEAADVSRGTFFNYFPTKESLLNDIADMAFRDLEHRVNVEMADNPSAVAKIRTLMRELAMDTTTSLRLTHHILLNAVRHPSPATAPNIQLRHILEKLVREAQTSGEIRPVLDPAHVTSAIVGVYLEAFLRWISADADTVAPSTADVEAVVNLLFEGIAAR